MKNIIIKRILMIALIFSFFVIGACGTGQQKVSGTLKILIDPGSQQMLSHVRAEFARLHPDLEIRVLNIADLVDDPFDFNQDYVEVVRNQQPDVILVMNVIYEKLAESGYLQSLDTVSEHGELELDDMHAPVLDRIRDLDGGSLTGITSVFDMNVLFYNETQFSELGVPYVENHMTWEDVFAVMQRFPEVYDQEPLYAFQGDFGNDPLDLINLVAEAEGIHFIDLETMELTIDTEGWKRVYNMAIPIIQSGKTYNFAADEASANGGHHAFIQEQAAMTIGNSKLLNSLETMNVPFHWNTVTAPIGTDRSEQGMIQMSAIYSIYSNADNPTAAWAFIKYAVGKESAEKQQQSNLGLSIYPEHHSNEHSSFTALQHKLGTLHVVGKGLGLDFFQAFHQLRRDYVERILSGELEIEQALAQLQQEAEALLRTYVEHER